MSSQNKQYPRLGCAVVIIKEEELKESGFSKNTNDRQLELFSTDRRLLLGIRGKEPNRGKWILPGGGVHFLEPIHSTAKREILEETGLEVKIGNKIGVYEIVTPPDEHRVIIYWWAYYEGGDIKPSSDIVDAKFFSKEEVRSIVESNESTEIVTKVLRDVGWA